MPQLAENPRTITKATIKRGSRRARLLTRQLDARTQQEISELYKQAEKDLAAIIRSYGDDTGSVRLHSMQQLLKQVNQRLADLTNTRNQILDDALDQSASLGVGAFTGTADAAFLTRVADSALNFVKNFIDSDGLQLADRLWRLDNGAEQLVGDAIKQAVIQGNSASEAVNNFLNRGVEVPRDIAAKLGLANTDRIARLTGDQLLRIDGNPRQYAMRVFRTEINRAHGEAFMLGGEDHPDFAGWKFLLSPRHPRPDICDMHANVNRYGLGPGVYPSRDAAPWPAHPNTLSFIEIVFKDEVTDEDRQGKEDRIEWLKKQPPGIQQGVLNSTKKRAALEQGILTEREIATPWKVLKTKYEKKGIDIGGLSPVIAEPVSLLPGGIRGVEYIDDGAPVSDAFFIEGQQEASKTVLAAIDGVHGDGVLPKIPIRNAARTASYYGAYYHNTLGQAIKISISAGGDHRELTLAHEIGHFLDHKGTPGRGFASTASKQFDAWRRAINQTAAVRGLRSLLAGPGSIELADGSLHLVNKSYLEYLTSYHELWARSYAQYIAQKSGNSTMLAQLRNLVDRDQAASVSYSKQWTDDDFKLVSQAIDALLKDLGWQ